MIDEETLKLYESMAQNLRVLHVEHGINPPIILRMADQTEKLVEEVRRLRVLVGIQEQPFKVGDRVEEICEGELEEVPVGTVVELEDHRGATLFRIKLENTKHAGLEILYWQDEIKKIEEGQ